LACEDAIARYAGEVAMETGVVNLGDGELLFGLSDVSVKGSGAVRDDHATIFNAVVRGGGLVQ
jgi:hypothetical protein